MTLMAHQSHHHTLEEYRIADLNEAEIAMVDGAIIEELIIIASVSDVAARLLLKELIALAAVPPLGIIWTINDWKILLSS